MPMLSQKTDNILEDLYLLRIFSKGVGWVMLDVSPRFRNRVSQKLLNHVPIVGIARVMLDVITVDLDHPL
jgi:hypothetical protein